MQPPCWSALGWIIILLGMTCCDLSELGDPIVVSDVEDEFEIIPWERLSPEGRSFEFRLKTLASQDCRNASINHQLNIVGNKINLSIRKIEAPQDCDPGAQPALGIADAGSLSPRFYELSIDLKNTVFNKGQLSVFGNHYVIDMESTEGFQIPHRELQRVPEQSVWGYVTYQHADNKPQAAAFLSDIASVMGSHSFASGYYGYFRISSDGVNKVAVTGHPTSSFIQQFIYQYEGELEELSNLIDQYRDQYKDQISIRIFTWTGEEL